MFWLKMFSDGPRCTQMRPTLWASLLGLSSYISVTLNEQIYAFRKQVDLFEERKETYTHSLTYVSFIHLSILDPQKLFWRHCELRLPQFTSKLEEINGVASYGGLIYVFLESEAFALDPKDLVLTKLKVEGKAPPCRTMCVIDDQLYAYQEGQMHVFNFQTFRWSVIPNPNGQKPMTTHCVECIAFERMVYIWGGLAQDALLQPIYCREMYVFNTESKTFEAIEAGGNIPVGREGHSMFLYDEKIFLYAGFNRHGVNADETCEQTQGSRKKYMSKFFYFDIRARLWKRCNALGTTRIGLDSGYVSINFCCEVIGSFLFAFGVPRMKPDRTTKTQCDYAPWFVLHLEINSELTGLCVQELMKNDEFDIAKLPPGLRRYFIQQAQEEDQKGSKD